MTTTKQLGLSTMRWLLIPLLILLFLTGYTVWTVQQWHTRDVSASAGDVSTIQQVAVVLKAAAVHRNKLNDGELGAAIVGDASTVANKVRANQVMELLEQYLAQASDDVIENRWADLLSQWDKYTDADFAQQSKGGSDTGQEVKLQTIEVSRLYNVFIEQLYQQPQENVMQDEKSADAQVPNFTRFNVIFAVSMAIALLSAVALMFSFISPLRRQLGASPDELQAIAMQLAGSKHEIDPQKFGNSSTGILKALFDIYLKFEEISTEKMLNKQLERELGADKEKVSDKADGIKAFTDPSIVMPIASSKTLNDSSVAFDTKLNLDESTPLNPEMQCLKSMKECEKALAYEQDIKTQYEQRIGALLKTVKSVASGDLTKRSSIDGDDDIAQIANYQSEIIDSMQRNLLQFGQQAGILIESSGQLNTVNAKLRQSSVQTAEQANLASSSSEEIFKTIDNVALAVKEMSASISEISENSSEAASVAEQAVTLAQDTDTTVRKLGESSTAIGAVIKVINSIAEQTNLLALNATIEAARAGEAGKGFAVVANEVKELAKETAKATEEIAQQISTIQSDSQEAVSAISDIGRIIDRVSEIQSTIAAAVEEQSVTTSEINRSIGDVSHGSSGIADNVSQVAETAHENLCCVENAQHTVDQLVEVSKSLADLVASYRLDQNKSVTKAA